ncbi:MAG TPA: hypothetical protein VF828_03515 [Patescibacteria group bacterium]
MSRGLKHLNLSLALLLLALAACTASGPVPTPTLSSSSPQVMLATFTPLFPPAPIATNDVSPVLITEFSVTPLDYQHVGINVCATGHAGVGLTIRVSYNTSSLGDESGSWQIIKELGVPCFNADNRPIWDISKLKAGIYLLKAEVKTSQDPDWLHPVQKTISYEIGGKG